MHTAEAIAEFLIAEGVPVRGFHEGDDMLDGEVTISEAVHVQVSSDSDDLPIVGREAPDGVFHYRRTASLADLPDNILFAEAEAIRLLVALAGFIQTDTGGGCTAFMHEKGNGLRYSLLTDGGDPIYPRWLDKPVLVGWYTTDGYDIGTIECPNVKEGIKAALLDIRDTSAIPTAEQLACPHPAEAQAEEGRGNRSLVAGEVDDDLREVAVCKACGWER
jgi:hypothetical protein